MVSNNKANLGGMNDRETKKLSRIDCMGDQGSTPPQVQGRGKIQSVLEGLWSEAGKRQLNIDTIREAVIFPQTYAAWDRKGWRIIQEINWIWQ